MFGLAWVGLAVAGVALLLSRLPAAAMGGHGPSPLMDPHCSVAGAALRDEATSSASSHLPGGRHLCSWVGIDCPIGSTHWRKSIDEHENMRLNHHQKVRIANETCNAKQIKEGIRFDIPHRNLQP